MQIQYVSMFTVFGSVALMVSCMERKFDEGSNVLHNTSNSAGMPTPTPAPIRTIDEALGSADMLKVLSEQTATASLQELGDRDCKVVQDNGPHQPRVVDCADVLMKRIKEVTGFEGIQTQKFSFVAYAGYPWKSACRPTKVRLQIHSKTLGDARSGLVFYMNTDGAAIAPALTVSAGEIFNKGARKGDYVEADFILLGKCGSGKFEFKPYIADYNVHKWEVFQGNHIVP